MDSDNTLEARKRRPTSRIFGDHPDTRPGPAPESEDISAHQAIQAERGVMHPDRDEMEWRYWRGGWGRLTE